MEYDGTVRDAATGRIMQMLYGGSGLDPQFQSAARDPGAFCDLPHVLRHWHEYAHEPQPTASATWW